MKVEDIPKCGNILHFFCFLKTTFVQNDVL